MAPTLETEIQSDRLLEGRSDWTERFPRIRAALALLRPRSATIDGEAVVCCPKTGLSLFDRLHSGRFDLVSCWYGFELLADLRPLPREEPV